MSSSLQLKDLGLTIDDVKLMLKKYYEIENTESDEKNCPKIEKCEVRTLGDVPAGIMSSHYIINVKLENGCWSCFVKCSPKDDFGSKYAQDLETFDKEGIIYQQLIPAMQEIAKGRTPWTAVCYLTKGVDLIVLENLGLNGFVPPTSGRLLNMDHLSIVLQTLARMNAASLALEEKRKKSITEIFPNLLRENGYPSNNPPGYRQMGVQSMIRTVQCFVKLMSEKNLLKYERYDTESIIKMIPTIFNELFELVKPSKNFRNVFNQSDLWANNIMFKYVNSRPVDCRLIDFQFSRYAPPVFDINTLLLTSTSRLFKEQNAPKLLDQYYNFLAKELRAYGLSVQKFITRSELDASFKVYNKAVLIESLCFFQTIYLPEETWTDLIRTPQTFEDFVLNKHMDICVNIYQTNSGYRNKITEILQELLDVTLGSYA